MAPWLTIALGAQSFFDGLHLHFRGNKGTENLYYCQDDRAFVSFSHKDIIEYINESAEKQSMRQYRIAELETARRW